MDAPLLLPYRARSLLRRAGPPGPHLRSQPDAPHPRLLAAPLRRSFAGWRRLIRGTMSRKGEVMPATYRAVLHGNHLEWRGEEPEKLPSDRDVEVVVTILDDLESPAEAKARGAAMAAALEKLAAAGGPKGFGDAAE